MQPAYANLDHAPGAKSYGLCQVKVAPREWLSNVITENFNTGKVNAPTLTGPRDWIVLDFTQASYEFEEKPKSNKAGEYFEISLSGSLNTSTPALQQVLETLRYHELIVKTKDRSKQLRLIGNNYEGMKLQWSLKQSNSNSGTQVLQVEMMMQSEFAAPFM